jgi:hypothetical protein
LTVKKALIFLAVLGLAAFLGAQSVADLAKTEKERRERFKDRHAVVVTNADLLRVKKLPAVEVANPGASGGEAVMNEAQDVGQATISSEADQASLSSDSGLPPVRQIVPRVVADGPVVMGSNEASGQSASNETLEAQLKASQDLVDLLTTKMNALRQQFESQDAMVPGYVIQQQLDETNQRLLKAQAQQARIEAQIAKSGTAKKAPGESER